MLTTNVMLDVSENFIIPGPPNFIIGSKSLLCHTAESINLKGLKFFESIKIKI